MHPTMHPVDFEIRSRSRYEFDERFKCRCLMILVKILTILKIFQRLGTCACDRHKRWAYLDKDTFTSRSRRQGARRHRRIGECTIEDIEVSHVVRSLAPTPTGVSAE